MPKLPHAAKDVLDVKHSKETQRTMIDENVEILDDYIETLRSYRQRLLSKKPPR